MSTHSGWQLSKDGPSAYEKYIVPAYTDTWAREIVKRACLQEGEKILDVACGTGLVARTAADAQENASMIAGIDVNEEMLKKAKELTRGINLHHCNVTDMPFPDNYFDVILCQQGLQYFPDQNFALKEMKRVLAENGRIIISVWRPLKYSPFYESLFNALEKYVNKISASMLALAFTLGDLKKLKVLFDDAGFKRTHIDIVIKQMRYSPFEDFVMGGIKASPFFKDIMEMDESQRNKMLQYIYKSNLNYIDDNGLASPTESCMVKAYK